jgi:hypothetical protein
MKKVKMTLMAMLASFAVAGAGAAVAFVANPVGIVETKAESTTINTNALSCGDSHFAIDFEKGGGQNAPAVNSGHVRMYGNNTMTITAQNGEKIQSISFSVKVNKNSKGKYPSPITANHGSVSAYTDASTSITVTGVGDETAVVLTIDSDSGGNVEFISCTITYAESQPEAPLESIEVSGSVAAKTLDTDWDVSGVVVTGHYEGGSTSDLTNKCDIEVADSVPAITADGSTTVQVTATLKDDATMTDTKALTASLTVIPLGCDQLYTADVNDEITIVGKYLASYAQTSNKAPDGVFIGNGDYGAIIYKSDSSLKDVTTDSYIKATGKISEFKGLRELGSNYYHPTFEVISEEAAAPYVSAPQDYTMTGTEANKNLASRQTLVRGTVASVSGTFASDADTTVTITLANENTAKVFLKKNQGSIIDYSGLQAALTVDAKVTIKGILSIYDEDGTLQSSDFQVTLPQLVEKDDSITAEVFCESLVGKTDTICAKAESLRHDELVTAWSDLKNDTFAKMTDEEIARLKSAAANYNNTSENPLENAMGRYNYLTKKYNLDNFLERDLTDAPVASYLRVSEINNGNHAAGIAVASIIVASALTVGAVFAIRRKKKAE